MDVYKVYVSVDESGRIVSINSSAFVLDTEGLVEIDRGPGDRFHHAQGNYLPRPLMDARGVCRYKLEGGKVFERTEEEMVADVKPPVKSELVKRIDRLETAINTVTALLEKLGIK